MMECNMPSIGILILCFVPRASRWNQFLTANTGCETRNTVMLNNAIGCDEREKFEFLIFHFSASYFFMSDRSRLLNKS